MPNLRITELPNAAALTGNESVPISQNGTTVQTTTGAIAAVPILNFTFLTATQQAGLANSRYLQVGSGLSLTDGGAQNPLTINLAGVLAAFVAASDGIIVKNGTTVLSRSVAVSGNGLSITNADGVAGNPTLSVTGFLLNVANLTSGAGLIGRDLAGGAQLLTITGTANQIAVTNGNGNAGNPTISLASNPVLPGVAGVVVPSGTTAERAVSATNGTIRYNTTSNVFEGYSNGLWGPLVAGAGTGTVTSVNVSGGTTGLTFTGGPIISNGTITMGGSLEVGYGGTGTTSTPTNGQILIGNSAGNYTVANITAGTNIAITNTSGGITISATAGAGTVTAVNATAPLASSGGTTPTISISGAVPIANGGTGQITASSAFNALSPITAKGDIIVGDGVNSSNRLPIGTNGYVLTADSSTATGVKWAVAASGMVYPGAGIPNSTGSAWGTSYSTTGSGNVVLSTSPTLVSPALGTPTALTLTNATGLPLSTGVTGALAVSNGGTGNTVAPTNGQLLIGNSSGGFSLATITAGTNVTVTNGNGTITISATAGGAGVSAVTATAPLASSGGGTPDISLTGIVPIANGGTGASSTSANFIFAGPNGTSGAPSFRAMLAADVPTLNQNTTGSAGSVVNALTINNSGSGSASGTTFNGSSAVTISYNSIGAPSATGLGASGTWAISISGNAATASTATSAGSVTNSVTFSNSGSGDVSGTTFNGSAARTISYNTLGAPSATGSGASGTWGISISGNAATATSATSSTTATNIAGGAVNQIPYQVGAGSTNFIAAPVTSNTFLKWDGTNIVWAAGSGMIYPSAGIAVSTGTAWDTSYTTTGTGTVVALATSPSFTTPILGTPQSGNFSTGTFTWPTFNQNTTGTAAGLSTTLAVSSGGTGVTTITGLIKGNGTSAFVAAVSGTDYAPATSGTSILYGNGSGGFSNVTVGSGLSFAGGTLSATGSGTPGGSNTQVQFNNAGSFGGSANFTWDGTNIQIGATGAVRFADTDSSNYVAFKAPGTVASNVTWTLPSVDGSNGQFLSTNGTGTLSWATASGGGGGGSGYSTYTYTGDGTTTTFAGASGMTVNNVLVIENGVTQVPTTDYTISGTNVVFTTAPASGVAIQIRVLGGGGSSGLNSVVAALIFS